MAQFGSFSAQTEILSNVFNLVETFRAFDADNDGSITAAELGGVLGSLGYCSSEQDVRAMMQQGDTNKDGLLSIQEFLDMNTKDTELGDLKSFLRTGFDALDVDGDQEFVTGEDLYEVMRNVGVEITQEVCQDIIASMDVDGDGVVSVDDIRLLVNALF